MNKNMKIVVGITIVIIITLGCVIGKIILENRTDDLEGTTSGKKNRTIDLEGTISGIDYKISNNNEYENEQLLERGFFIDTLKQPNSPYRYIITMGEKNTGGYSIKIVNVKIDKNKNVEVIVRETEPPKNSTVTMEFTYPTCCLELSERAETIVIKNTKGETFKKLN